MSTATMKPKKEARRILAEQMHPDMIGVKKNGNLILCWGFFYTHGRTAAQYAQKVEAVLSQAAIGHAIVDQGEVWKPFRGGGSAAQNSHFFVEVTIGVSAGEQSQANDATRHGAGDLPGPIHPPEGGGAGEVGPVPAGPG
jgi:hypothetical protein